MKNSVYPKMAKIIAKNLFAAKKGFNKFQQYKYATEVEILETIREAFNEVGLIYNMAIPSYRNEKFTLRGKEGEKDILLTNVDCIFTVIDPDTGDTVVMPWPGSGTDTGDKGMFKAMTGGQKYWFAKNFMIATGDDPELDNGNGHSHPEPVMIAPPPAKVIHPIKETLESIVKAEKVFIDAFKDATEYWEFLDSKEIKKISDITDPIVAEQIYNGLLKRYSDCKKAGLK